MIGTGLTLSDQKIGFFLLLLIVLTNYLRKYFYQKCLKYSIDITKTYDCIILYLVNSIVPHPVLNFLQAHFPKNIRDLRL